MLSQDVRTLCVHTDSKQDPALYVGCRREGSPKVLVVLVTRELWGHWPIGQSAEATMSGIRACRSSGGAAFGDIDKRQETHCSAIV